MDIVVISFLLKSLFGKHFFSGRTTFGLHNISIPKTNRLVYNRAPKNICHVDFVANLLSSVIF